MFGLRAVSIRVACRSKTSKVRLAELRLLVLFALYGYDSLVFGHKDTQPIESDALIRHRCVLYHVYTVLFDVFDICHVDRFSPKPELHHTVL
jgi:hypothetical protein